MKVPRCSWYTEIMHPFKSGDVVKCLASSCNGSLIRNKTYTVLKTRLRIGDNLPMVMVNEVTVEWWRAERFVMLSEMGVSSTAPKRENVDVREEQLRAMLTTTNDPFTCKKCGAPKATCIYH